MSGFRLIQAVISIYLLPPSEADICSIPEDSFSLQSGSSLVLVTGGAGFIGSHLVETLLKGSFRVRVVDSFETGSVRFLNIMHPRLEVRTGSIDDIEFINESMQGVDAVFHLAAASKVAPSLKAPSMATFNVLVNAVGTARLLEAAKNSGSVKRFIYAASSTYYGNQKIPFAEYNSFVPSSPYAASKYMGELMCSTYDKVFDLPCVNLRFFMVYGPRQPSAGAYAIVTGKFVDQFKQNKSLTIEGTGEQFRDFIHVKDIVRGLMKALGSSVRGQTINLGTGTTRSIKQLADLISSNQTHVQPRPHDLHGTLANTSLAETLLDFKPCEDFEEEILRMKTAAEDEHVNGFWKMDSTKALLASVIPGYSNMTFHQQEEAFITYGIRNVLEVVSGRIVKEY
jgi:nucleoside-diphosphate-sugar epimerase